MVHLQTNRGLIVLDLNVEKAPKTVANFLAYAREGFFTDTIFHRVIDGFMIQGGGFGPDLKQKATRPPIDNEANNGLRNSRGSIAMARTSDPHSASSQFFINVSDNDFLNFTAPTQSGWGYCVFGQVIEGMDVVDAIKGSATTTRGGYQDVPVENVIITGVQIT